MISSRQSWQRPRLDLEENEELRAAFLGQTGVHIGAYVLQRARQQFNTEESRLKERIALIEKLLVSGKDKQIT